MNEKKIIHKVTPIGTARGEGFVLPNNSGDHQKSIKTNTPINNTDLVNKAYCDGNGVKNTSDETTNESEYVNFQEDKDGLYPLKTSNNLRYNPSFGLLTASKILGNFTATHDSAPTNTWVPLVWVTAPSVWSYLYCTSIGSNAHDLIYNPSEGRLYAPFYTGDGSLLTGIGLKYALCEANQWKEDTTSPPTWYDTGFNSSDPGYNEFWGADTSTTEQYLHFVIVVPEGVDESLVSPDNAYFYVNYTTTNTQGKYTAAWRIDWCYSYKDEYFINGRTYLSKIHTSGTNPWLDMETDESLADLSFSLIKRGGKFVCRITRDINDTDTETDVNLSLLVVGMRFHQP